VCGDFNQISIQKADELFDLLGFKSAVDREQATHRGGNRLDQVYTNLEIIKTQVIQDALGVSDHNIISCELLIKHGTPLSNRPIREAFWTAHDAKVFQKSKKFAEIVRDDPSIWEEPIINSIE
jgi:hypothetical protein